MILLKDSQMSKLLLLISLIRMIAPKLTGMMLDLPDQDLMESL